MTTPATPDLAPAGPKAPATPAPNGPTSTAFTARLAVSAVLLAVYYARFFLLVRQEVSTLVQIAILLIAALLLALPERVMPRSNLHRRRAIGTCTVTARTSTPRTAPRPSPARSTTPSRRSSRTSRPAA